LGPKLDPRPELSFSLAKVPDFICANTFAGEVLLLGFEGRGGDAIPPGLANGDGPDGALNPVA